MTDIDALKEAVRLNPGELAAQGALYDALQESGLSPLRSRREVNRVVSTGSPLMWHPKALRKLLRPYALTDVESLLSDAQAAARRRTITIHQVLKTAQQARKIGVAWITGGRVANSYRYPAESTCAIIVCRTDGRLEISIARINANGSPTLWATGLPCSARAERFVEWASNRLAWDEAATVLEGE